MVDYHADTGTPSVVVTLTGEALGPTSTDRLIFFAAFSFLLASLGPDISPNSLSVYQYKRRWSSTFSLFWGALGAK